MSSTQQLKDHKIFQLQMEIVPDCVNCSHMGQLLQACSLTRDSISTRLAHIYRAHGDFFYFSSIT